MLDMTNNNLTGFGYGSSGSNSSIIGSSSSIDEQQLLMNATGIVLVGGVGAGARDDAVLDGSDGFVALLAALPLRDACLLAFFATIIVVTVLGNTLVILAVLTTRRLRTVTNCFVMSLAVADWLVGVFVMPPSVLLYLYGEYGVDMWRRNGVEFNTKRGLRKHYTTAYVMYSSF